MDKKYRWGMTIYVCIGKYAGVYLKRDLGITVTLGWISFALVWRDIEAMRDQSEKRIKELGEALRKAQDYIQDLVVKGRKQ
jgi:hypothetical protein